MIDQVYYINLDKRTDRLEHLEKNVLPFLPVDKSKMTRISAVDMTHEKTAGLRAIGCSSSHIKAWEDALMKGYKHVMILEDDFEFAESPEVFSKCVEELFQKFKGFGVCNFAYNPQAQVVSFQESENFFKCNSVQTTSGYIINSEFMQMLIQVVSFSIVKLLQNEPPHLYAIDQAWKVLQRDPRWIIMKKMGKQMESYSDIEDAVVNYAC